MARRMTPTEKLNWNKYHIPGVGRLFKRKINTIHVSMANSKVHEMAKCSYAYDLMKSGHLIITEAERNRRDSEGKIRRPDLIDLSTGIEFEFETDPKRAKRFDGQKGVHVIKLWD